jgi:hypothetical protein
MYIFITAYTIIVKRNIHFFFKGGCTAGILGPKGRRPPSPGAEKIEPAYLSFRSGDGGAPFLRVRQIKVFNFTIS